MVEDIIAEEVQSELLKRAYELGFDREAKLTEVSEWPRREANLRRLAELCLEKGWQGFSEKLYLQLNPLVRRETPYGELRIGKGGHLSWTTMYFLTEKCDKAFIEKNLMVAIKTDGQILDVSDNDLTTLGEIVYNTQTQEKNNE